MTAWHHCLRPRLANEKSLQSLASQIPKNLKLADIFYPFGRDADTQLASEPYDGADNRDCARIGREVRYEAPVDFQTVELEAPEHVEGRPAGSEIVQNHPNPETSQLVECSNNLVRRLELYRFCDLKFQSSRG